MLDSEHLQLSRRSVTGNKSSSLTAVGSKRAAVAPPAEPGSSSAVLQASSASAVQTTYGEIYEACRFELHGEAFYADLESVFPAIL